MPRPAAISGPGHFKVRLVKKGPWVAALLQIEAGVSVCTIDGKRMDPAESYRWVADIGDEAYALGPRITEPEYLQMLALVEWAKTNQPDHPVLNPRRPISLNTMPSLF